ncbi:hypothetical protein DAPPUDRAFT_240999 [Daphnia pulex]|uniref:CUB domain-containing protein n=1 Tax=Daphnia pulex TaxID=6669 RepID=E9GD62_DAPPU|nr:hypothetical protein DAPPUDRAFT_240999 [Daphnia pulex]|eukprot:EFX82748.1 hypothetical protein DAPPUDRAFT_240999 [Daphnia pulex]
MTRLLLLLASVHHAILVFSCASLLLFGSLSIGDTIGDGHDNQTAVTAAPAEHRGSTKAGHNYWRWGYRKTNQIDRLELPQTALQVKGGPDDVEHLQPRMDISFWNLVPCYSIHTEPGLCLSTAICAAIGGTPSGSCMHRMSMTKTCCIINKILTTCSANVVANNTYWQSPLFGVDSGSVCVMALHLNTGVIRQNLQSICQVRLDFDMFSIAQPNTASVCSTDVFRVAGSLNTVPPICGDNSRQHMYLTSKSTARNIQLIFSIGSAPTIDRSWRMKISLLPCDADYLESTGTVKSFNWKDVAASANRQLADQDYQICFRTELVGSNQQVPNTHCLTECSTTNGGLAFSLSRLATVDVTSSAGGSGVAAVSQCANDFLFFLGGFDVLGNFNDRFCGNRLNPTPGSAISTPICSKFKPFHFRYVTDGAETGDGSNNGCVQAYTKSKRAAGFIVANGKVKEEESKRKEEEEGNNNGVDNSLCTKEAHSLVPGGAWYPWYWLCSRNPGASEDDEVDIISSGI